MNDELERLKEDRDESEIELERLEEELAQLERDNPDYEDDPDWENLYHEVNESSNWVNYLNACISSHEGGYED